MDEIGYGVPLHGNVVLKLTLLVIVGFMIKYYMQTINAMRFRCLYKKSLSYVLKPYHEKLDSGKRMDCFLSHLKLWPDRNLIRADTSLVTDQGNAATGDWEI